MKTVSISVFLLVLSTQLGAQSEKPILVFDLEAETVDSITNIGYDENLTSGTTNFFVGNYFPEIEQLELSLPTEEVYPGSQYTLKQKVSDFYDVENYPNRTTIKLFQEIDGELISHCSGSMISRRHVLTATHCLANSPSNELFVERLFASPAFDNGSFPWLPGSYVKKIYFFRDWDIASEDFAILELEEPIGDEVGWISIGFDEDDDALESHTFYKFSYPNASVPWDSNEYNGDTLYFSYGAISEASELHIIIEGSNGIPGESGSSIIHVENEETYTSYGTLTFATNQRHSRFRNYHFHAFEQIIEDDLEVSINPVTAEAEEVILYPNPTNGRLSIECPSIITSLKVLDLTGRLIRELDPKANQINLSDLPVGTYVLQIETEDLVVNKKIILRD
ncbi:T9SS type A sorting domain-containing protein [Halocola ammonii]